MNQRKLSNIVAIVNEGYSDLVMDVARECGARGGTVISANGSASAEAEKLYGISVQPQKEIILILVDENMSKNIMENLYSKAGSGSEAMGVFFSLPVTYASENLVMQYSKKEN